MQHDDPLDTAISTLRAIATLLDCPHVAANQSRLGALGDNNLRVARALIDQALEVYERTVTTDEETRTPRPA